MLGNNCHNLLFYLCILLVLTVLWASIFISRSTPTTQTHSTDTHREQNCTSAIISSTKSASIKCKDGHSWCTLLRPKDKNPLAYLTYRLLAFSAAALTQANFLPAIWRHQLYTPSTASGHSRSHSARTRYTTPCSNSVP